jgi:hypothetical protein
MRKRASLIVLLFFASAALFACATTKKEGAPSSPEMKSRASYYDFEDVIIPAEMKLDSKNSFIYSTTRYKAGVLTFNGRVEAESLALFFQNNMPKDGWRPISVMKFRGTMLVFLKEDRACVISIREGTFSTALEVRVGPIEPGATPARGSSPR